MTPRCCWCSGRAPVTRRADRRAVRLWAAVPTGRWIRCDALFPCCREYLPRRGRRPARIIGDAADPEIVIAVTASHTADLRALHQRLETEALSHVRHAVSNTSLPIQLHLDVSRRTT